MNIKDDFIVWWRWIWIDLMVITRCYWWTRKWLLIRLLLVSIKCLSRNCINWCCAIIIIQLCKAKLCVATAKVLQWISIEKEKKKKKKIQPCMAFECFFCKYYLCAFSLPKDNLTLILRQSPKLMRCIRLLQSLYVALVYWHFFAMWNFSIDCYERSILWQQRQWWWIFFFYRI